MSMCKRIMVCAALVGLGAAAASAQETAATAEMQSLEGQSVGQVRLQETPNGLIVTAELTKLPEGPHGFHIHAVGLTLDDLFDNDGSSMMVHAGADDYASDPAGDAGAHIACGVVSR